MNILLLIFITGIVLSAIGAPVVFALRRRARLAAALALAVGFGAQSLFLTYLQSAPLSPEQGAFALLAGIPGLAILICVVTLFAIARATGQTHD
ncbi:MAG: hypothetical protein AB7O98_15720 [Hyphomonadaceae bacterium]